MRSNPENLTAESGLRFSRILEKYANHEFAIFRDQLSYLALSDVASAKAGLVRRSPEYSGRRRTLSDLSAVAFFVLRSISRFGESRPSSAFAGANIISIRQINNSFFVFVFFFILQSTTADSLNFFT